MDDLDGLIEDLDKLDFPVATLRLFATYYDYLVNKNTGQSKVKQGVIKSTKKIHDYISERAIAVFKENVVLKTKIEENERRSAEYRALLDKIERKSVTTAEEEAAAIPSQKKSRIEDHAVIITAVDPKQDLYVFKQSIKNHCKQNTSPVSPGDVVVTKAGQVIMKMKSRREAEVMKEVLQGSEEIKSSAKIVVPFRKRERVLVLGVDTSVDEDLFKKDFGRILEDFGLVGDFGCGLAQKLKDPSLSDDVRAVIEKLYQEHRSEFRIVRKIETRAGKVNWLVDVDQETKAGLLLRKRICIDYERYRVVEHVNIIRCFKCQEFGHMSGRCQGEQRCLKCSGSHGIQDCKAKQDQCPNCYFAGKDLETDHRADSPNCPSFKSYRDSLIPPRL